MSRLLLAGAVAGPLYVTVSLAEVCTRDGFDPTRHAWSQLANGGPGWIHTTDLIVSGALVVAGAAGLRPAVGRLSAVLLGLYGAGMIGAGLFRADPGRGFPVGTPEVVPVSWHGTLHFAVGAVGFLALAAACFRIAPPGWAAFSRITGAVFLASFAALAAGGGSAVSLLAFTGAVILVSAWICAIMTNEYRVSRTTERVVACAI